VPVAVERAAPPHRRAVVAGDGSGTDLGGGLSGWLTAAVTPAIEEA
jgi:hypothetical protein